MERDGDAKLRGSAVPCIECRIWLDAVLWNVAKHPAKGRKHLIKLRRMCADLQDAWPEAHKALAKTIDALECPDVQSFT